jgi:hypothetical protein
VPRRAFRAVLVTGVLALAATAPAALAAKDGQPRSSKVQLRKALKQSRNAQEQAEQALQVALQALAATGNSITTGELADGSVTTPKLADGAVTAPKIEPGAVTAPALGPGAVVAGKIGPQAINSSGLFSPGVLDAQSLFGTDVIGPSAIAGGAVGTSKIGVIPSARVTFTAPQTIPDTDASYTTVIWDQETFDTANLHSGSSPNLTAPVDGIYQVSTTVELNNASISGSDDVAFFALIQDQGGNVLAQTQNLTTYTGAAITSSSESWFPIDLNVSALVSLSAGESAQVQVLENTISGTHPLDLNPTDSSSSFAMTWVGPQTVGP